MYTDTIISVLTILSNRYRMNEMEKARRLQEESFNAESDFSMREKELMNLLQAEQQKNTILQVKSLQLEERLVELNSVKKINNDLLQLIHNQNTM